MSGALGSRSLDPTRRSCCGDRWRETWVPNGVRWSLRYRFRPDFCEVADPESKGIVENLVGYAKSDLLTPLLLEDNLDLAKNNEAAKAWCSEVNAAIHADIAAVPQERLAQERLLLAGLPSLRWRSPGSSCGR
jgi:hypothetical protein